MSDDKEAYRFLECNVEHKISFSVKDVEPYNIDENGISLTISGRTAHSRLKGLFNLYNIVAAASAARSQGVGDDTIVRAIEAFEGIPGRVQKIYSDKPEIKSKQDFTVIVDYAHTADSLEKLYQVFEDSKSICVLGGTGGGRDRWKRRDMGRIADNYCDEIILTDEDPYDEDPKKIVDDICEGIVTQTPTIIMDRREAIREAIKRAKTGDSVLITGKGTDPYIMGPNDTKTPWSDAKIAREEIEKRLS
ncbi:MAG: hypothetical protein M1459_00215 [Patescibacteria group bacterium]|nr:hypothetical protein [Patescibacteria group bacterium]